jgi:hypothetical protein
MGSMRIKFIFGRAMLSILSVKVTSPSHRLEYMIYTEKSRYAAGNGMQI